MQIGVGNGNDYNVNFLLFNELLKQCWICKCYFAFGNIVIYKSLCGAYLEYYYLV